jgi:hypothetical protein
MDEYEIRHLELLTSIEAHLDWLVKFLKALKIPSWLRS